MARVNSPKMSYSLEEMDAISLLVMMSQCIWIQCVTQASRNLLTTSDRQESFLRELLSLFSICANLFEFS